MATQVATHASKMDAPRAPVVVDGGDAGDVDVEAMLAAMRQSAQRLDGMLQRIYAAPSEPPERESEDDDGIAQLRPVAGLDSEDAPLVTCAAYFDAVRAQREHRVAHRALRGLLSEVGDNKLRNVDAKVFAAATGDVTYMFPAPPALYVAGEDMEGEDEEQWDMAEALALESFQQRVVQCVQRADHAVPPTVTDAIATLLTRELLAFCAADGELQAIGALFPASRVAADTVVEWRRGNRICKLHATERERRRQWGLEVALTLETVARAQALAVAGDIATAVLGPPLSCTTTNRVFVPKAQYESLTAAQLMSTSYLCVSVTADTSTTVSMKTDAETETAEENDEEPAATLPEFLDVWYWGGHATLLPSGEMSTTSPGTCDATKGFQTLDVRAPFPRNRIVQAACGRLHTLLLSDVGLVFSFGHAMDGALGHGDALRPSEVFVAQPKLVDFFVECATAVQSVACGGDDLTGFHSAAVATDGTVYTWGVGPALGLGSVKSHSTPQRVRVPLQQEQGEGDETATSRVVSVSCGSGFCVALASDGSAFAWGKWSDGRLGLGAIPVLTKASRQHGTRRQLQRFQLSPKRLSCESHGAPVRWRQVSCGDAHCVALSRTGHAYVWGRGRQGQLGLGDVCDAMTPVRVSQKQWCDAAAGQDWSVAVDAHGAVWSWGACGASVLGLSDGDDTDRSAALTELLLHKHLQLRQSQLAGPNESKSSGSEAPPRFPWLRPQPIPSLSHGDAAIRRVSAGARHAAAISKRGDLYVWGSPQRGLAPQPKLMASSRAGIGATIAEQVFCGGSSVVALTSGSFLANAMRRLYDALQSRVKEDGESPRVGLGRPPAGADVVLIVGGGRALFAHKLVLARRSSVLRELILNEERPLEQTTESSGAAATPSVTELLLPQLRVEIARVLLEFLYTDNLTTSLDPLSYLIRDVLRAARAFRIPKLVRICRARIESASSKAPSLLAALHADDQAASPTEEEEEGDRDDDGQGHSLNDDLAFAFGDATWSDLRVVAEGRAIPVHSCVLLARSEYFRALLAFHAQQAEASGIGQRVRELVVEESYAGMLRVLNFIYHDELTTVDRHHAQRDTDDQDPDDSDRAEQLLEDLIAADKYGLVRMKRLCEHHVRVSAGNVLDVLVVADLVRADHLKQGALAFLQRHLDLVNASEGGSVLQRLAREFPHLLAELHGRIQRATQQQSMLREWQRRLDRDARALQERQAQRAQRSSEAAAFPWVPLVLAVAFATLYLSVMNARESDLPVVPAVNVVVVGGLLTAAFVRGGV